MSKWRHRREGAESEHSALQRTPIPVRKIPAGLRRRRSLGKEGE